MISARLMGGMGNQMFIYAAARGLAAERGDEVTINHSGVDIDLQRCYSLSLWRGVAEPVVPDDGVLPKMPQSDWENRASWPPDYGVGWPFSDYWQDGKYFAHIADEMRACFVPAQPPSPRAERMAALIRGAGDRSVITSIRRGDYLMFGSVLPREWYERAAEVIASRVPRPHFFVSTDDPGWAAANFRLPPHEVTVLEDYDRSNPRHLGREDEELWLHGLCRHALLANSTYSWWGAWLAPKEVVVAPRHSMAVISKLPYPEGWIEL